MGDSDSILVCDMGNTATKIGIAGRDGLDAIFALPTRRDATADSMGMEMLALLRHADALSVSWKACVVASVTPALNAPLRQAVQRYLHCPCLFVPGDIPVPLENRYTRPAEVGADRLVAAWAARGRCPDAPSVVVVDFGTAVTFDCVEGNAYLGGLIFPGPATAMSALASRTAKLPQVALELDSEPLRPCQDTATSIRHGLIFGYAALVEGLCRRLTAQLRAPTRIVATGGFAATVASVSPVFDEVLSGLMLEGLSRLYFGPYASQASGPHMQRS